MHAGLGGNYATMPSTYSHLDASIGILHSLALLLSRIFARNFARKVSLGGGRVDAAGKRSTYFL